MKQWIKLDYLGWVNLNYVLRVYQTKDSMGLYVWRIDLCLTNGHQEHNITGDDYSAIEERFESDVEEGLKQNNEGL